MGKSLAMALAITLTACTGLRTRPPLAPVTTTIPKAATPPQSTVPVAPTTVVADPLTARLDAVLVNTNSCLLVADAASGAVVYNHQGDVSLAPASSQKLLVAAAAIDRLGPDFRFTTTVVSGAPPVNGRVDDLWLVGAGDPLLVSPEYAAYLQSNPATAGYPTTPLSALADQLIAHGVRSVSGGIHGDDSRYETLRYLPTWTPALNIGEFDIGPLGALEVDQGLDRWRPSELTADPAGHGAGVLARLLTAGSVAVGQGSDGRAPGTAVVLARVVSSPLTNVVEAMLRASDNQIAELLVRELDRQAGGRGTTAGGVRVVAAEAKHLGLSTDALSLIDGSGLSAANRVSCRTLLGALDLGDQARFTALAAGLPVAAVSGTLYNLFRDTPAAGHLAAKGGYIKGVSALVGRLDGPVALRFAFVVNGSFPYGVGLGLQQRVVGALSGGPPNGGALTG